MASGKLTIDNQDRIGKGRYSDLHTNIEIYLEPNGEVSPRPGSNTPSHNVYVCAPGGKPSLAGAAWLKEISSGKNEGEPFYSIQIDDPSFRQSLNLSAFPSNDATGRAIPGEFEIVWRRPRQDSQAA